MVPLLLDGDASPLICLPYLPPLTPTYRSYLPFFLTPFTYPSRSPFSHSFDCLFVRLSIILIRFDSFSSVSVRLSLLLCSFRSFSSVFVRLSIISIRFIPFAAPRLCHPSIDSCNLPLPFSFSTQRSKSQILPPVLSSSCIHLHPASCLVSFSASI